MRREMPFEVSSSNPPEDFRLRPHLLETGYQFLFLFFVPRDPKYLLVSLHRAVNGISPCLPENDSEMEVVFPKCYLYSLTPYCPQQLGPKDVPGSFQGDFEGRSCIPA